MSTLTGSLQQLRIKLTPKNDATYLAPPPPSETRNIFPIWALGLYRRLVLGGAKRLAPEARPAPGEGAGWVCAVSDYYTA
jgi:hypothetical protein